MIHPRSLGDYPDRIPLCKVLLLGTMTALSGLSIDMYIPALPRMGAEFRAESSVVQLSITAFLIGLAAGQIVIGPLSDTIGRRRPLVLGLAVFVLASAACALAPSVLEFLIGRFVQGCGAAAPIVIGRAMIRDLYSGYRLARFFSLLVLVVGVVPLVAPQIGAVMLLVGSWRAIFAVLGLAGLAIFGLAATSIPETLPPQRRVATGLIGSLSAMRKVCGAGRFRILLVIAGSSYGAMLAYFGGSAFMFQNVYGFSPLAYSTLFAVQAMLMVIASQIGARLVSRCGSLCLLWTGVTALAAATLTLLGLIITGPPPVEAVQVCFLVVWAAFGLITPNVLALALEEFPESAGSASAVVGLVQYASGALAAPLVGLWGDRQILPLVAVLSCCGLAALVLTAVLRRPRWRPGMGGIPT